MNNNKNRASEQANDSLQVSIKFNINHEYLRGFKWSIVFKSIPLEINNCV